MLAVICILMKRTFKNFQNGFNDNDCEGRGWLASCRYHARRWTGIRLFRLEAFLPTLHRTVFHQHSPFVTWFHQFFCSFGMRTFAYVITILWFIWPVPLFAYFFIICCGGSQSGCNILEYQNQAKMLFRKLGPQSPLRCSIETGPYLFQ